MPLRNYSLTHSLTIVIGMRLVVIFIYLLLYQTLCDTEYFVFTSNM